MKNVQISFDENLLEEVDRFAASEKISRSAIVRKALKKSKKVILALGLEGCLE